MENPFEFGRELGVGELVDREDEIAQVVTTVREGGKLFVIGPRRYGKTSILKAAEEQLAAAGAIVLRCDAEIYPSLDLLVAALIAAAARGLRGGLERTGANIRNFFGKLRPEASFSVTEREWTVRLGVAAAEDASHHVELLVDALNGVEKLAQSQPKSRAVGLLIDEFQKVIELGGRMAEAQIRAAIQQHRRTGYVFAGSKTRLLTAMTMDVARPFYRLGALRFIGAVPATEFREFLRQKLVDSGFSVPKGAGNEAVQSILELAEEVPYNVQVLAHACWDHLRAGKTPEEQALTQPVVQESLDRVVRGYDPFYTQLWNGFTGIQQKTLVAVIKEGGINLQSIKVSRAVGTGPSSVRRALQALIARDVLREEQRMGSVRMRFEDPFFAQWIRRFTPQL
jgi:uncharacterized protein